ncbi:hypothetical protein LZ31DRAFT_222300 [Colletotrichum somersetense]|nr:hypothetical protein LZ31DRAFT_222300 [Colletotrichum somersetense]
MACEKRTRNESLGPLQSYGHHHRSIPRDFRGTSEMYHLRSKPVQAWCLIIGRGQRFHYHGQAYNACQAPKPRTKIGRYCKTELQRVLPIVLGSPDPRLGSGLTGRILFCHLVLPVPACSRRQSCSCAERWVKDAASPNNGGIPKYQSVANGCRVFQAFLVSRICFPSKQCGTRTVGKWLFQPVVDGYTVARPNDAMSSWQTRLRFAWLCAVVVGQDGSRTNSSRQILQERCGACNDTIARCV